MTPASGALTSHTVVHTTAHAPTAAASALSGVLADVLLITGLGLAAFTATAVVLTRAPVRQAIVFSGHGLVLALLFLILQAPDVALSQIGVGAVVVPLIVVLTLHATRRYRTAGDDTGAHGDTGGGTARNETGRDDTGRDGGGRPGSDPR
ncbi:hypothetical protein BJF79_47030 [Actinomadura sp. CNU-125]|uniref:Na(+)/H(+) antiporter subunit B n=1 Tax=Actinomadura sp. CNU-125 TaxID=1904961 RepID=UPI000964715E|nr:DUF4040 domain-containing protein [Actinomadura sp. CNU-125]OLT20897.1 hypothetical protein BJF79_47030 [Actinomadura sp. CNU-125]